MQNTSREGGGERTRQGEGSSPLQAHLQEEQQDRSPGPSKKRRRLSPPSEWSTSTSTRNERTKDESSSKARSRSPSSRSMDHRQEPVAVSTLPVLFLSWFMPVLFSFRGLWTRSLESVFYFIFPLFSSWWLLWVQRAYTDTQHHRSLHQISHHILLYFLPNFGRFSVSVSKDQPSGRSTTTTHPCSTLLLLYIVPSRSCLASHPPLTSRDGNSPNFGLWNLVLFLIWLAALDLDF